jgi:hypothetical protein
MMFVKVIQKRRRNQMNISALGIDIAKNVFQLHGVDVSQEKSFYKKAKQGEITFFYSAITHLPNRNGSLWWFSLLGKKISKFWSCGKTH